MYKMFFHSTVVLKLGMHDVYHNEVNAGREDEICEALVDDNKVLTIQTLGNHAPQPILHEYTTISEIMRLCEVESIS